jgi:RNA polymerase sigma factor (sigma-70 family)
MKKIAPEDENQLVTRLHARDEQAMAIFYRHYRQALFRIILRIVRQHEVAEDVLQESMTKFWLGFPSYDRSKGRLFTWALRISRNLAIDRLRAQRLTSHTESLSEANSVMLAAPATFRPEHLDVRDWLQLLDSSDRQLMELLYFEGHTYQETAERLHLPEGTVKTRGRRIIRLLAQILRPS